MKIELVGGPRCGELLDVTYIDHEVPKAPGYRRRDRELMSSAAHDTYGKSGARKYDWQRPA